MNASQPAPAAPLKVLGLALYSPLAASTRHRMSQYVPGLARAGIDLHVSPLLGDDYLRRRFAGAALSVPALLRSGLERLGELAHQRDYDAVVIQAELLPLAPAWLERALIRLPYVYDFDDALYLKYRTGRLRFARGLLGSKFDSILAGAAAVTAGSRVLEDYARRFSPLVHHVPTVVDTQRYLPAPARRTDVFTVGWIGSPSTAPYLRMLVEPLAALGGEGSVRLIVIGGKAPSIPGVAVQEVAWQEDTEVALINTFDVGVMPLPDDEWARGKCAFKLVQYMACGVPVVASPVGANRDVVSGDCGLLAATPAEWLASLRQLRDGRELRAAMGRAGRERVQQHYSLQGHQALLAQVIRQVAGRSA